MSTVTFDTLKFVETLKKSGFDDEKAKGIATAYQEASSDQELVTKNDLELALQKELAPIKAEMQVMKWMNSLVLGGIILLILKSFF
ncbi:MAG: hypothetical protein Q8O24_06760 [Gallionellaceae bacterium]|nr:hypothetical protein [Gallionellaceae bacterium]